ncbi:MAG: beta-lactamase family protein [Alphaproteobacteria bacterium]|nr:beta-lactamase family protein [Alphaproteobacteria bacterium]MBU2270786.1 beta-lactamase family protein [Alphaproteobacteria bacterium]MBU2418243.1 beta-lactamase family protein [Alphaproteobacteria bacterium]
MSALSRRAVLCGTAAVAGGCAALPGPTPSPDAFEPVLDLAMADASTSVLVSRNGTILAERYAAGWGPDRPREVASVAKSVIAVLIAMAAEAGAITGFDQSAADFIPAWRGDARAGITLRHLMSMTSGLDDTGLALRGVAGDQFAINAGAPLRHPPGTRWAYNTAAYHLLFHVLERATGQSVETFAGARLFGPLGMDDTRWVTSTGAGAAGPVTNWYSAASTARDLARFGELILGHGVWSGRRLIGAENLRTLLAPSQDLNPSYGLLWWSNARRGADAFGRGASLRFPDAPRDTVAALGAGGQMVLVVPSRELIVVRQGEAPGSPTLANDLLAGALRALA